MTVEQIDLSPPHGWRLPRPGASRRAWLVAALAAAMTLAFASALEYANRAKLREELQMPLSGIDTGALRDLTTAMAAGDLNPFGDTRLFELVAERYPDSPAAAYALWRAHIHMLGQEGAVRMAIRAAEIARPDNPRYEVFVRTAAHALKRAGRRDEAIALVEDAMRKATPKQRGGLQKTLESVRGDGTDGD